MGVWRIRATRERAELLVEPWVVPDGGFFLLRCLLTVGRRRDVEDGAEDEENEERGEDKPTPTVPIKGGDGVGVARRGVIPSCCCDVLIWVMVMMERINLYPSHQWKGMFHH